MGSPAYGRTEGFDIGQNPVGLGGRNIQRTIRTLPAVVADTQLLAREVAVPAVRAAAVGPAVGDVAGLALPVLVALAVHLAGRGGARRALPVAGAIVGTRVD